MTSGRLRRLAWFFCDRCGSRVLPHTKFDAETVAPEPGDRGSSVLLSTWNNQHPDDQLAWCLACKAFVTTERLGEAEIWSLYFNRRGVEVRFKRLRELRMVTPKIVSMHKRKFIA